MTALQNIDCVYAYNQQNNVQSFCDLKCRNRIIYSFAKLKLPAFTVASGNYDL